MRRVSSGWSESMTRVSQSWPSSAGNEHLDRLLADPQIAADVAQAHAEAEEMDRVYAMNLAMIRKAAQLTQVEVAKRLGVGQAAVSRMENRGDMLLSTLYDYLTATGADAASIVVVVHGQRIELDLGSLRTRPAAATR
jgi:DNA-binding XRE family transcriptional regulator